MTKHFGDLSPVNILVRVCAELLEDDIALDETLVSQGLDSISAADVLDALAEAGLAVAFEDILDDFTVAELAERLQPIDDTSQALTRRAARDAAVPLTPPQYLWASLEDAGWGDWGNISLCVSIPAHLISANRLPALAQALTEDNDALRMVLRRGADGSVTQSCLDAFDLPVTLQPAPAREAQVMRLIEAFEGQDTSPFAPSARALILAAGDGQDRHWLCLTMHHVFSDRLSMHALRRQIEKRIANRPAETEIGFADFAVWTQGKDQARADGDGLKGLSKLLERASLGPERKLPALADPDQFDLGPLPLTTSLTAAESVALDDLAHKLGTTLPVLLHALFSVLHSRLVADEAVLSGKADALLCHVVSNREAHPALREMVGCFDTSVPVAVPLDADDTLKALCQRTRKALSAATQPAVDTARGGWLQHAADLFEQIPHVNIVREVATSDDTLAALDIREHPVRRVQKTRWGMLFRARLPATGRKHDASSAGDEASVIRFSAFAEDRALAGVSLFCLTRVLRSLLGLALEDLTEAAPLPLVDRAVAEAKFAAAQVKRAAALVPARQDGAAFLYEKLIARQQRWYKHTEAFELERDALNRFVGTAANPFPFTQLDKLAERAYLEERGIPLPNLRHVLPKEGLTDALVALAPDLPGDFALKPVGAGHSFGVTLVRDGLDKTRNGVPFNPAAVGAELTAMAERGSCVHEGNTFPFNFSSFLIEDLVIDANGFATPTDYKLFVIGDRLLWIQLHFKQDGHTWVAFLDETFQLTPQPAWDPTTCWRTHGALVCTDQAMADARRPDCLDAILSHSRRLGAEMGIFVRLDWYADHARGPLMGEVTLFPHMLQPRGFYTEWANSLVQAVWQDPDGCGVASADLRDGEAARRLDAVEARVSEGQGGVLDMLPSDATTLWAKCESITYSRLRAYIAAFDLSGFCVSPGARVAILAENGAALAALLFSVMHRHVAVPLGSALPDDAVVGQMRETGTEVLLVLKNTRDAEAAKRLARKTPSVTVIELTLDPTGLAQLPPSPDAPSGTPLPARTASDPVLLLRTSGSTGAPKSVVYSLDRLMRAGASIARSLALTPSDHGLSMLPLHHVGGISCNLVAPALVGAPMTFCTAFDPKTFFQNLSGPDGASWCYMVPALWEMVLEYGESHAAWTEAGPWPNLRALRNAGAELPPTLATGLAAFFGPDVAVLPTYGMTEAMPIAAPPPTYRLEQPGSVGPVLPDVSIEIIDPAAPEKPALAAGQVGEITVKGPTVFTGYDGAAADQSVFTTRGFFRTGDLGVLHADGSGWLSVTGRIKDAINRGGETLAPAEIEAVLQDYPGWRDAVPKARVMAFARAHQTLGEDVALAVAPLSVPIDMADLTDWARGRLSEAMVPKTVITVPELAMSPTGKRLRARFAAEMQSVLPPARLGTLDVFTIDAPGQAPQLVSTQQVASAEMPQVSGAAALTLDAIVAALGDFLGDRSGITAETRLEDLGVNSLAAVELASVLNARFGAHLPAWAASDHPTPRGLFDALGRHMPESKPTPVVPEPQAGLDRPMRLLFLHGEGADADLMDLSFTATRWQGQLQGLVEFVFLDAPHACAPKPEFHPAAVDAGFYTKASYRSWGCTEEATFQQSVEIITKALTDQGPFDAIGGMCDGALLAAYVAAKRPDLTFYFNVAANPVSRLPAAIANDTWSVPCPSLHVLSPQDEMSSVPELLEIAARCERATLVQHAQGHAVPQLTGQLYQDVVRALGQVSDVASEVQTTPAPATPLPKDQPVSRKLAQAVRKTMANALGRDDMGPRDDFFDLGGTSMMAMALTKRLEKMFSASVPVEELYRNGATPEALAQVVANYAAIEDELRLVPLNASTAKEVFYCLPPLNGHLSDYLSVGQAIADTARLEGLSFRRLLSNRWERPLSLQALASCAAETIDRAAGGGRIHLMGNSLAGTFAFETARELLARGREVHSLSLIDSDSRFDPPKRHPALAYVAAALLDQSRSLRGKSDKMRHKTYLRLRLKAELADWDRAPIRVNKALLVVAREGRLSEGEIDLWRKAVSDDLDTLLVDGPHGGLRQPEIAAQIVEGLKPLLR
ncbi:MAG: AMP-binding protein [Paracoccaceae bacterium]